MDIDKFFGEGFSKLSREQRLTKLLKVGLLKQEEIDALNLPGSLPFNLSEQFIENMIGHYNIPLGIAVNFFIDDKTYIIPMATEETSVIAAASRTAKWLREVGEITTENLGYLSIGQIQIATTDNFEKIRDSIEKHKTLLISKINQDVAASMVKRGGGLKDILIRKIPRDDGKQMVIFHVLVNTCDAMGANIINQICENLKHPIEHIIKQKIALCILSNLADTKLTLAKVVIKNIDKKTGHAIEEASLFAEKDPYRAATNNKGILNGMDAVTVATGNDWRALEAGVHAYAAINGHYSSITHWRMEKNDLVGILKAPINVGTKGGITQVHPTAKLCLKMLGVEKAAELARIIAAVGIVQNLGALRALTTEGICSGHMKLHLTNLCLAAGAKTHEIPQLKKQLQNVFKRNKHISESDAEEALRKMRNNDS